MCRSTGVRPVPIEGSDRSTQRVHNVRKRLGPGTSAQLVADYQAGLPTAVLMERYGIGKGTVLGILHEADVVRRREVLTDEQLAEAA